ncbi:MAG: ABC transporter permease, partial [Planctomycetota bacterium]
NFKGYRVVGTTTELFTDFEYQEGSKFTPRAGGRIFDPTRREAVIGATAARELGLNVRSTFQPYHGLGYDANSDLNEQHDEEYLIVGVLEPTNSPSDRVIWIPIEGVFRMEGHVLRGSGESYTAQMDEVIPDEAKEVSAVMLKFPSPRTGFSLDRVINKQGKVATLAWPIDQVMAKLFKDLGWMNRVLELVAYLVLAVVAGSILASLYNTMNERRREFAILRALGAKRGTVFSAIVLESTVIAGLGALLGFLVYLAILAGVASVVRTQTGVVLDLFSGHPAFLWTPIGMLLLGAASGLLPAFKAYSTDVAENLSPTS